MRRLPVLNGTDAPWLSGLAPVCWQFGGEASLAGCRQMRRALAQALQALALTEDTRQALLLGVTELATNVVCHSSPPADRFFMVIRQRGGGDGWSCGTMALRLIPYYTAWASIRPWGAHWVVPVMDCNWWPICFPLCATCAWPRPTAIVCHFPKLAHNLDPINTCAISEVTSLSFLMRSVRPNRGNQSAGERA